MEGPRENQWRACFLPKGEDFFFLKWKKITQEKKSLRLYFPTTEHMLNPSWEIWATWREINICCWEGSELVEFFQKSMWAAQIQSLKNIPVLGNEPAEIYSRYQKRIMRDFGSSWHFSESRKLTRKREGLGKQS